MWDERDVGEDLASVEALHDAYRGPLYVFAFRSLGDREAAQEIVQDTLVRAWRHADRYDPERGSVPTWLFTIARNLIVDRRRRWGARPRVVAALDDVDIPVDDPHLDRVLEAWQVAEALGSLSEEHRAAIVEVHYRGRSVAETAELLGVPPGTVKSRVYYGLRALRLHLEEMGVVG